MALWQLLNLGPGCTITHCEEGLNCGATRVLKLRSVSYVYIYTGGCQKKGAPHQKRFTWIIMATNKENVDKSYVFVLL